MYPQTTAVLAELGAPRLSAVLGVEHEQVSLAACNLLHVMFDSLKEGLQKEFRGKEDAVVLGECPVPQLPWGGEGALGGGPSCSQFLSPFPWSLLLLESWGSAQGSHKVELGGRSLWSWQYLLPALPRWG